MNELWLKTNELIKKSFDLWDLKDWNVEDIDPIVKLLFAACANESVSIDKRIKELAAITKDSLINELLPYSLSGPRPACGMIKCSPTDPMVKLNQKFVFEYEKPHTKGAKKDNDIFTFQPAFEAVLLKASILYQFAFDQLVSLAKNQIYTTDKPAVAMQNSVFIALKLDNSVQTLEGLTVFFSVKRAGLTQNHLSDYDFLNEITLQNDNFELKLIKPIDPEVVYTFPNIKSYQYSHNLSSMADLQIEAMSMFSDFYYQISSDEKLKHPLIKSPYPDFFNEIFEPVFLKQFKEDLVWLEFKFDSVHPDLLKTVDIHINAFPVLNQRVVLVELDKEEPVKKIPLTDNEDFIGVTTMKLFDDYRLSIESSQSTQTPFILREMEMEKYGKRDLFDLLEALVDHYIADSYAFQEEYKIKPDEMNRLREVMKPLVAAKMKGLKIAARRNMYAIYHPGNDKQISAIEITCSLTNGTQANGISSGERLKTSNPAIDQSEIVFLSKTFNGYNRLSQQEKSDAVKRLMLSGDRIVSTNDIKEFCYQFLGNKISSIRIEQTACKRTHELRKCIRVNISLKDSGYTTEDLLILKRSIENKIRLKSNLIMPVIINFEINQ